MHVSTLKAPLQFTVTGDPIVGDTSLQQQPLRAGRLQRHSMTPPQTPAQEAGRGLHLPVCLSYGCWLWGVRDLTHTGMHESPEEQTCVLLLSCTSLPTGHCSHVLTGVASSSNAMTDITGLAAPLVDMLTGADKHHYPPSEQHKSSQSTSTQQLHHMSGNFVRANVPQALCNLGKGWQATSVI